MAITKIHSIESTLNLAIAYIVKPNKTEEQKYVEGYACTVRVAFRLPILRGISTLPIQ